MTDHVPDDVSEDAEPGMVSVVHSGVVSDARARMYSQFRPQVYRVCFARLRNPDRAEDAVQDTFLRAFANFDSFDSSRNLLPWLLAIAVRRCIDIQRRDSKTSFKSASDEVFLQSDADTTVDRVINLEEHAVLVDALRRLPQRQRRSMMLFAVEGRSYADIALAEGLSITATKALLHRARVALRLACCVGGSREPEKAAGSTRSPESYVT